MKPRDYRRHSPEKGPAFLHRWPEPPRAQAGAQVVPLLPRAAPGGTVTAGQASLRGPVTFLRSSPWEMLSAVRKADTR